MALISGQPISTVPISAQPSGAPPVTDDDIPQSAVSFWVETDRLEHAEHPVEYLAQAGSPIEDTAVTVDDVPWQPFSEPQVIEPWDDAPDIWARGPPDQDDELVINVFAHGEDVDDAPGVYSQGSPDQDDEFVADVVFAEQETDDEPQSYFQGPPDDAAEEDASVFAFVAPDVADDSEALEPYAQGPTAFPDDETGETIGGQAFADIFDEEETLEPYAQGAPDQDDEPPAGQPAADVSDELDEVDVWAQGAPDDAAEEDATVFATPFVFADEPNEDIQALPQWPLEELVCIYPDVSNTATAFDTATTTNHTVNLPSGIVAGDRLISFFTAGAPGYPAGWTEIIADTGPPGGSAYYRDCDGTEGASITVTTGSAVACASAVYLLLAGTFDSAQAPEGASIDGTSSTPNPPSLSPSWGTDKSLWVAAASIGNTTIDTTAWPTGYDDNQLEANATAGTGTSKRGIAVGARDLEVASDDPGTFTTSVTLNWVALTVAVLGACPADDRQGDAVPALIVEAEEYEQPIVVGQPLEDEPPFADVPQQHLAQPEDFDELPIVYTGQPLEDGPAVVDDVPPQPLAQPEDETEWLEPFAVGPLEDEATAPPAPAPAPTISGGGAGWWVSREAKRPWKPKREWPALPELKQAPPWRPKVVTDRYARARLSAEQRQWKQKLKRSREAEDALILAIVAGILGEDGE